MVYLHSGMLINKREQISDICKDIDEVLKVFRHKRMCVNTISLIYNFRKGKKQIVICNYIRQIHLPGLECQEAAKRILRNDASTS